MTASETFSSHQAEELAARGTPAAGQSAAQSRALYRPSSPRPKSPHISIYRWPITMAMSIAHRAAGAALYAGAVFLVVYLGALACGERAFQPVQAVCASPFGQCALFLYTLALVHHMMGGIRHLVWDAAPRLLEKRRAGKAAWATVFASLILTAFIWAAACIWF